MAGAACESLLSVMSTRRLPSRYLIQTDITTMCILARHLSTNMLPFPVSVIFPGLFLTMAKNKTAMGAAVGLANVLHGEFNLMSMNHVGGTSKLLPMYCPSIDVLPVHTELLQGAIQPQQRAHHDSS